jgi:hypothetical protein
MRWNCDGVDKNLDLIAELFRNAMADCLGILEIVRDEGSEVNRIADAEEDVSICQRARALDLVEGSDNQQSRNVR